MLQLPAKGALRKRMPQKGIVGIHFETMFVGCVEILKIPTEVNVKVACNVC
jgi:hypothetical protein